MLHHSEAVYSLRKYIFDKIKIQWPQLKSITLNDFLGASKQISTVLENAMDRDLVE